MESYSVKAVLSALDKNFYFHNGESKFIVRWDESAKIRLYLPPLEK